MGTRVPGYRGTGSYRLRNSSTKFRAAPSIQVLTSPDFSKGSCSGVQRRSISAWMKQTRTTISIDSPGCNDQTAFTNSRN
eukprot:2658401-Rhodomonas_salina.2